jgi:hypothetical protein
MIMKNKIASFLVAGISALLLGCYPQGPEFYEDLDVVYTNYDDTFDFVSKGTYSMPDKIVKIEGNLLEGEDPEFVNEPYNTQMLDEIESNMSDLGWTRVDNPEDADLTLFPASWTNTTVYYWYDYWCWYYPWYCGYGWGYPSVSSYTTGTLVMTLVANGPEYIEPARVWTGAANGVLSGAYDINRAKKGIDQAFTQSPYLKTN